jgi:hypothetical protein
VTQRLYRGFCHEGLEWDAVFRQFEAQRERIAAVIERTPALEEAHRSQVRAYVAGFYEIIASAERRQGDIVEHCRPLNARS